MRFMSPARLPQLAFLVIALPMSWKVVNGISIKESLVHRSAILYQSKMVNDAILCLRQFSCS